jgi:hypothetical protein
MYPCSSTYNTVTCGFQNATMHAAATLLVPFNLALKAWIYTRTDGVWFASLMRRMGGMLRNGPYTVSDKGSQKCGLPFLVVSHTHCPNVWPTAPCTGHK